MSSSISLERSRNSDVLMCEAQKNVLLLSPKRYAKNNRFASIFGLPKYPTNEFLCEDFDPLYKEVLLPCCNSFNWGLPLISTSDSGSAREYLLIYLILFFNLYIYLIVYFYVIAYCNKITFTTDLPLVLSVDMQF